MLLERVDAALFIYLFVRSFIWLLLEDEIAFGKQCFFCHGGSGAVKPALWKRRSAAALRSQTSADCDLNVTGSANTNVWDKRAFQPPPQGRSQGRLQRGRGMTRQRSQHYRKALISKIFNTI